MKTSILQAIEKYNTIIIHRHVRPDPDALGSQCGLAHLIKDNYPNKKVHVVGDESDSLTFLARMDHVDDSDYQGALVIVCDTANQDRISDERYSKGDYLIKIDHHPNEDPYGDILWVDTEASSVSEMIVDLYEEKEKEGFTLSKAAARLLFAGIVGDTGRFLFSNTTPETFRKAAKLRELPFDMQEIFDSMYESDLKLSRLNGYILQNFELTEEGTGFIKLTLDLQEKYRIDSEQSALLINTFSNVKGIKAWVHFIEEKDRIRVRLRSKGPVINTLAARYNGGGHPMASGATVFSWEEADQVLAELKEICREYPSK